MASEDARPEVFVDSNVVFSGIYSPLGAAARILALHSLDRIRLVISRQVAEELVRNLRQKAPEAVPLLLGFFASKLPRLAQDPYEDEVDRLEGAGVNEKDAPIVAAAVGAGVQYFVTGDRRLRNEIDQIPRPFRVVTPRQLIEELTDA